MMTKTFIFKEHNCNNLMFPLVFIMRIFFKSTIERIFVGFGLKGTSPIVVTMSWGLSCSVSFTILS